MKLTIEIPDTLVVPGAGAEMTVKPGDYHDEALAYILKYGFHRAHQDRANSIAKKLRDNGEAVDGESILADVSAKLRENKINQRGDGTGRDEVERKMISLARKPAKESDAKRYKAMDNGEREEFVWAYIEGLPKAQQDAYRKMAEKRIEDEKREAEEMAAMAKELGVKL